MKLIDSYLQSIGSKLPIRSRQDIKQELRSLLLDEIEATYGDDPTEEQVKEAITQFGAPGKVAARYQGDPQVIAPQLAELYFLIAGILVGAMTIAFTVVFIVAYLTTFPTGSELVWKLLSIPMRVLSGSLSGIGGLTIVFIILSRIKKGQQLDPDEDWSVDQLEVTPEGESRIGSFFSIVFLSIFCILLVTYPGIVTALENLFGLSGIPLGHRLVVDAFRWYAYGIALLGAVEIGMHAFMLKSGIRSERQKIAEAVHSGITLIFYGAMLLDSRLYSEDTGWIGFKVVFFIIFVVSIAELIGFGFTSIRKYLEQRGSALS